MATQPFQMTISWRDFLAFSAGIVLLFLFSLSSSWVYYLGTGTEFGWIRYLLGRSPSFGLWIVFLPILLWVIDRILKSGISARSLFRIVSFGFVISIIHRLLASLLSSLLTDASLSFSDFFTGMDASTLFPILAYVLDSFLIFLLIAAARLVQTGFIVASRAREETLQLDKNLADARLNNLSMQFQPHFIFNALQGLSMMIYKNPPAADSMIMALSDLLRKSMQISNSPKILFSEELNLANRYMEIQEIRFGERLTFQLTIEPETENAWCPPFLLQPLLENAVKHGVEKVTGPVFITLNVKFSEENLELNLSNSIPDYPVITEPGLGLRLIRERLELLYHQKFTFSTQRQNGVFTVFIAFPSAENEMPE